MNRETMRPWAPLVVPPRLDGKVLDHMLNMLVALDEDYLKEHPRTPMIYDAYAKGMVKYVSEPKGQETWKTVPWMLLVGHGVCHSLAAWRTAELRIRGEDAKAVWSSRRVDDGSLLYHVQVRRQPNTKYPTGRIEDPSAMMGMGLTPDFVRQYGPTHGVSLE